MSQIETAVLASKKIEAILRDGFAAEGRGLHEYLASVEHRIPVHIVKKARYIASVRNQVVHKDGVIADLADFNQAVAEVVDALNNQLAQEQMARENEERLKREQAALQHSRNQQTVAGDDFKPEHTDLILSLKHFKTQNNYLVFLLFVLFCLCVYLFLRSNSQQSDSAEVDRLKSKIVTLNNELRYEKRKLATLEAQLKQIATTAAVKEPVEEPAQKVVLAPTDPKTSKADSADAANTADLKLSQQRQVIEPAKAQQHQQPVAQENSLLAKARSATNEYDKAYQDIKVNFVRFVQEQTKVTLGQPDVFQNANGSYSVRVPVSWTIPERELLSRLNRYFNSYDSKPLKMSSEHMRSEQNRLVISKSYAESSTAIKPYSGRLFGELQKVELSLEVSLGNKKGRIIIAGNARCHVSCGYADSPSDSWIIQSTGKPGLSNLHWQQESPLVIEGFTEQDLHTVAKPMAVVTVGRN